MDTNTSSNATTAGIASEARRRAVAGYIHQRVTDAGTIARLLGGGEITAELVREDIKALKSEWRKERRALLDEVGDSALRALDADESMLRSMLQSARREGTEKLGVVLKLMDMIESKQKLRLQLAGLLSTDGMQSFRSGVSSGDVEGDDGVPIYRVYEDEIESEAGKGSGDGEGTTEGSEASSEDDGKVRPGEVRERSGNRSRKGGS